MNDAVCLSGVGVCGSFGTGADALLAALASGSVPVQSVPLVTRGGARAATARAALADPAALKPWLAPLEARRMSPPSRMAVAAARMALADAGLPPAGNLAGSTGTSLGTAYGCISYTTRLLDEAHEFGWQGVSPMLFTETVANVHAGQIALAVQATGPNYTFTQREASALTALGRAWTLCTSGACDRVLTGAVDELSPVLLAVLNQFRMLARPAAGPPRPFDPSSPGCLAAEGACVLLAEPVGAARARGARADLRLLAVVRANDPSASPRGWGDDPATTARRLRSELARHGIAPQSLDRIVSGAAGIPDADRAELARLEAVFGPQLPALATPKSAVGEYGGNSLAAAVAGVRAGERVLLTSAAVGGAVVWAVLERDA